MRRISGLLPCLALLTAAAPPPPLDARDDARRVLATVVRDTTASRGHASDTGPLCVQRRLTSASLGGGGRWRRGDLDPVLLTGWQAPSPGQRTLTVGDREAIREAMRAAFSASTQRRWLSQVERGWVAPSLTFCANDTDQRLVFWSPVIVGDVAFVLVALECRQHCGYGYGADLALRRTARGWDIVARHMAFIS